MRILARFWHLGTGGIEVANGKHGGYCHRQQLIIISLRIYSRCGHEGWGWGSTHSLYLKNCRNHNRISLR